MKLPTVVASLKSFEDVEILFKIELDLTGLVIHQGKEKKKINDLLSTAKTVFLSLIQSPTSTDEMKVILANRMFHIYQAAASAIKKFDNKRKIKLQQESLIYLTYGYGLALSLGRVKEFDARLLRRCIVENRFGGRGGVLNPDDLDKEFSKKDTFEFFIKNALNLDYDDYWLVEREENFMAFARGAVNLFIRGQIRDVIDNEEEKIKDTETDLDRLLKKRVEIGERIERLEKNKNKDKVKELKKFKEDFSRYGNKIKVLLNNIESKNNNLEKLKDHLSLTSIKDLKELKNSLSVLQKQPKKGGGSKNDPRKESILVIINTADKLLKLHEQMQKEFQENIQERLDFGDELYGDGFLPGM